MLDLEPLTVAVVRNANEQGVPEITILGSSGVLSEEASLHQHILQIHGRAAAKDGPGLRIAVNTEASSAIVNLPELSGFGRAQVFSKVIDDDHRLYVLAHQATDDAPLAANLVDALAHIASELGKLLRCLFVWQANPEALGATFERLTEREWIVLRGLNSEDGEKQLADRLGLSPHTLHSHIKSIYRKVGVQGRLPLLLRLNAAVRDLRSASLTAVVVEQPRRNNTRSVAYAVEY
jgi:DNA-binding NarL/FixJ family response regulator